MEIVEKKEVRKTISLDSRLADMLEKDSFFNRQSIKQTLEAILENHYKNQTFENYPPGYQRPKTGRPKK